MKRIIKFRGKDIEGVWRYGSLLIDEASIIGTQYLIVENGIQYIAIPETVGQFTGLTDKNGKEIYEGDIVKARIERAEFITVVTWGKKSGGWSLKCDRTAEKWGTIKYYKLTGGVIEIISNIHDNPELLTKNN